MKTKNSSNKKNQGRNPNKGGSKNYEPRRDRTTRDYITGPNPWEWHVSDTGVLEDIGKLNFNYALGSELPITGASDIANPIVPGVIAMHFLPNFGISVEGGIEDGLNMAANQLFAYQRSKNAGSTNYTAQDPMMFLGAMDSVYTFYYCLIRLYGTLNLYNQRNLYYPRAIVRAMGFDYDDFINHLADFKFWLDHIASVINMRSAPKAFTAMAYHMFRVSEIYKDVDEDKAQLYLYVPDVYYVYQGYTDRKGGRLVAKFYRGSSPANNDVSVPDYAHYTTFAESKSIMEEMLSAILADEDFATIWGDLIKAYGLENMYTVPTVADTYSVLPKSDAIELWTIHNTILAGYPSTRTVSTNTTIPTLDIYQDPAEGALVGGKILYNPRLYNYAGLPDGDQNYVLDVPSDISDAKSLVDILRNRPVFRANTKVINTVTFDGMSALTPVNSTLESCGSVLPTYASLLVHTGVDNNGVPTFKEQRFTSNMRVYPVDGDEGDATPESYSVLLGSLSKFKCHPIIYAIGQKAAGTALGRLTATDVDFFGACDHYTIVPKDYQTRLNLTTNYSELAVKTV